MSSSPQWARCPGYVLSSVVPLDGIQVQPGSWQALGDERQVGSWGGKQRVGCPPLSSDLGSVNAYLACLGELLSFLGLSFHISTTTRIE